NPDWQNSRGWRAHDYFFTFAERIGQEDCVLPTLGVQWHATRPLVVTDLWKPEPPGKKWTTVMTWNNFRRTIEHLGVTYGTKELEFPAVETLPSRTEVEFELAVGGANPPREHWRELGWAVVSSEAVSRTLDEYRAYIQGSRGEFSVAKNVYVATRSGWFSCRSVCYLAACRPVVVQDTGFSELIPSGHGLFAFSNVDEAQSAIEKVERDYADHQNAARELAREYFDAERVLNQMLVTVGLV
ncbi:MAG TPA: glycosyltransferase family 1 protein, partial [Rhodothermia bacterium]